MNRGSKTLVHKLRTEYDFSEVLHNLTITYLDILKFWWEFKPMLRFLRVSNISEMTSWLMFTSWLFWNILLISLAICWTNIGITPLYFLLNSLNRFLAYLLEFYRTLLLLNLVRGTSPLADWCPPGFSNASH